MSGSAGSEKAVTAEGGSRAGTWGRWGILVGFVGLLAVPLVLRPEGGGTGFGEGAGEAARVIVVTPHNEQIRHEFGRAFADWHERKYGERVGVVWSTPGGTSEIRRMLEAQYAAALAEGRPLGGNADLVFGGGAYEHDQLKRGVTVEVNGETRHAPISEPIEFDEAFLREVYGGRTEIGSSPLYDEDGYWYGTALSGFGIVYNRDVLRELGVDEPTYWRDLCDPRLFGWVALGNPGQSGSIRKSFDTVLQRRGWEEGWRILRRAAANARYFSASSSKVPIDVSQGDAAAGVSIDFYGRYQAQAIAEAGDPDRVGYVDPPGVSAIDADPISMLRGAPHPELATRFVRFTLTETGQALWQFRVDGEVEDGLGPERFELRRMPIRPGMYEGATFERFVDRVRPYELAKPFEDFDRSYWAFIPPLFGAMAMENHDRLQAAWEAIITHPAYPRPEDGASGGAAAIVTAADVTDPTLKAMLEAFDAMPTVPGPGGERYSLADREHLPIVAEGWFGAGWTEAGLWPDAADPGAVLRRGFTAFFRERYERVIELARDVQPRKAHAESRP